MRDVDANGGWLDLPSDQNASGRSFDEADLDAVAAVLASGHLTSTRGAAVPRFEAAAVAAFGTQHATACSSGSTAVHAVVAAIDPEPGEEIVTTPITDMGALAPILYQGAIPVFADVDPETGNVTAASVAAVLSERTRAVVVTHLFGNPADLDGIGAVAAAHGVPLIEDAAQAWLARSGGRLVGTVGVAGCFSLQQAKHVSCGEGGLVITDDADIARRVRLWVNKGWDYDGPNPDHAWLAPNARMSELQGAVAAAQFEKATSGVASRVAAADVLSDRIDEIPGLSAARPRPGDTHSYWRYPLLVDPDAVPGGPEALAAIVAVDGVASAPRYIRKPAFRCGVFTDQKTFGSSRWPFPLARPEAVDYDADRFPGTAQFLDRVLVLPWTERHDESHAAALAKALSIAVDHLRSSS